MLNTVKLRTLYSKIQTQLFYMIPEKWDKIYLYASIIDNPNSIEKGEMFFYYYPKGLLKKNPVNVYEVSSKFNVDEESYLKLVDELYNSIKELRKEFERNNEKLWSNLTISVENLKFNIEYDYDNLNTSVYSSYDRHIIWKYKYLNFPIERLSKKDQRMLERYLFEEKFQNNKTEKHIEGMYKQKVHNIIEYEREENEADLANDFYEELRKEEESKLDKYELYKRRQAEKNKNKDKEEIDNNRKNKNQILNF